MSVYPHAHYLGKEMRLTATVPDGANKSFFYQAVNFNGSRLSLRTSRFRSPAGRVDDAVQYETPTQSGKPASPRQAGDRAESTDGGGARMHVGRSRPPTRRACSLRDSATCSRTHDGRERVRESPGTRSTGVIGGAYVEGTIAAPAHLEEAIRLDGSSPAPTAMMGRADGRDASGALVHLRARRR